MYDKNNIFAKILRNEIPSNRIIENEYAISFYDINPLAQTHVLIIPRGEYTDILDFTKNASADEKLGFLDCFTQTAEKLNISDDFNILSNAGANGPLSYQEVFHLHLHLVAGKRNPELATQLNKYWNK